MNLQHILNHDDPVLLATFFLLISMSLVSWYLIFWKSWQLSREKQHIKSFRVHYSNPTDWVSFQLENPQAKKGTCLALLLQEVKMLQSSIPGDDKETAKNIIELHLSQQIDRLRSWMDKGLTILASIGSSAPFIGLFGTVWGIYGALTAIAVKGNASLNIVAGPMGEALIATAAGLFAAIPAVLAYNAFLHANRLLMQDLRHLAEQFAFYIPLRHSREAIASENMKLVARGA